MLSRFKIFLLTLFITISVTSAAYAADEPWVNDLRRLFLLNSATIYELNLRTFNANDTNGNGIIDFDSGEESGNFINAIDRLDELKNLNIIVFYIFFKT